MSYAQRKRTRALWPVLIAAGALALFLVYPKQDKHRAIAGIPDPVQEKAQGSVEKQYENFRATFEFQYSYDIRALVVSTKDYSGTSVNSQLAPRDLALAWGSVAAHNDTTDFHWQQSGRFYSWRLSSYAELAPFGSEDEVNRHSANNHVIPADEEIAKKLKKIRVGDYIRLKGYLVNITAKRDDGADYYWNSSTTREDTGDGACEVIYVTEVSWPDQG